MTIVKDGSYYADGFRRTSPTARSICSRCIADKLGLGPLAGFVVEGLSPYGTMTSIARRKLMMRAVYSGMPVVRVGRGNTEGFAPRADRLHRRTQSDRNQGAAVVDGVSDAVRRLPPAADPDHPTETEKDAIRKNLIDYQRVFDTH